MPKRAVTLLRNTQLRAAAAEEPVLLHLGLNRRRQVEDLMAHRLAHCGNVPAAVTHRRGSAIMYVRISANVTGDFGNVTDLGLGAGLRG